MRHREIFNLRVFLATFVILSVVPISANAELAKRDHASKGEIWESDIKYYAATDTYYQLFEDYRTKGDNGVFWHQAASIASMKTYQGRRGRLAIINTADQQSWILSTFKLQTRLYDGDTWIGFRYMCSTRKVINVVGEEHQRSAFSLWDVPWYRREDITCTTDNISYMPVYIDGIKQRWKASGPKKAYPHYLVEYPPT
jgi:hypothetical protein